MHLVFWVYSVSMTLSVMTFHESYGDIPKGLLTLYRRHGVSQADHDMILATFGFKWDSPGIPWSDVLDFVLANVEDGSFRLPIYL